MTPEEKAKAYDEAVKKIKNLITDNGKIDDHAIVNVTDLEGIFPELQESEDERMRAMAIKAVYAPEAQSCIKSWGINPDDVISWLKKQKAKEDEDDNKILQRFAFYAYEDEPDILYLANVFVNKNHRNKGIGSKIIKIADTVASSMGYDSIRLQCTKGSDAERLYKNNGYNELTEEDQRIWLEKQGEQKPTDKVKPKFKVGDWIVSNFDNVACIESISETKYNLRCKDGNHEKMSINYIDGCWHQWTIQDAKVGDVLYTSSTASNEVFIFKELTKEGYIKCYCSYDSEDKYCEGEHHVIGKPNFNTHPATKERRDLLFSKMKEAGYECDAEKKELRKIEQNPAWSEEDEVKRNALILLVEEVKNQPLKRLEDWDGYISWLKSLKDRYTWEPSDEQMKLLQYLCETSSHPNEKVIPTLESLYQDLKKLRGSSYESK